MDGWKTCYKKLRSRVTVNGHCSEFFLLGCGTRQGDALSPSLFALSIEPLAKLIRSNPLIQGIDDEGNNQHKLALFTDDILIFLENPITSIPVLLHNLIEYSKELGYKVYTNKSEAMMIVGDWPSQLDDLVSFRRSNQGFTSCHVIVRTAYPFPWGCGMLLLEPIPAMSGSVSRSRTLRHAAQPCLELGFEPVTFQSLVDLLYPLSYSRPFLLNHVI